MKAVAGAAELKDTHDVSIAKNNQHTFPEEVGFTFYHVGKTKQI